MIAIRYDAVVSVWNGRTAVVTGGAGGLGVAFAHRLAQAGASVALWDMDGARVAAAAAGLRGQGHRAAAFVLDVTDPVAVAAAAVRTRAELGEVSVVVNNAGVVVPGDFLTQDLAAWDKTMAVNVRSYFLVTQALLPGVLERGGRLIYVASAAGLMSVPGMAVYSASKHAVVGFADSLRLELARSHPGQVAVTTVCPSFIATGMFDGAKPPRGTRWLTADEVAERALTASAKGRPWVREPALVKLVPLLKALPTRLADRLCALFGIHGSMEGFHGKR